MKTCNKCNESKTLENFAHDSSRKGGYKLSCSICYNKERNERRKQLDFKVIVDKFICHTCQIEKPVSAFHKNKMHFSGLSIVCKECRVEKSKNHYEKYKEKIAERVKGYNKNNKEKINATRRAYQTRKMKEDPLYVLSRRLRNRLYYAMKKKFWKKDTKFFDYIGCSLEELKTHIETQFLSGMSWELRNFDIDHIVPLVSAKTEEEMYKLCHYTNLKPMWPIDNRSKGAKL